MGKKEKKRMKKEKRRRDKEDKKRRKRKLDKDTSKATKHETKKRKHNDSEESVVSFAEHTKPSHTANCVDANQSMNLDHDVPEEAPIYDLATKANLEKYKKNLLSRVPKKVKSRFREGGFSRWGKDWLPVLELGPFDVEPGPVRDMWLEMFDNTRENGRE